MNADLGCPLLCAVSEKAVTKSDLLAESLENNIIARVKNTV